MYTGMCAPYYLYWSGKGLRAFRSNFCRLKKIVKSQIQRNNFAIDVYTYIKYMSSNTMVIFTLSQINVQKN